MSTFTVIALAVIVGIVATLAVVRKELKNKFPLEEIMRDTTRVVRAGLPAPSQGAPFLSQALAEVL